MSDLESVNDTLTDSKDGDTIDAAAQLEQQRKYSETSEKSRGIPRRTVLGATAAGIAALAGCSTTGTSREKTPESTPETTEIETDKDNSTETETETEEPVEYPRRISQEEINNTGIGEIYNPTDWGENSIDEQTAQEHFFENVDFEAIENEYDTRQEQIKETLKQTTSYESSRVNGHIGMIALQQLSWADPEQGQELMVDEGTVRKGGERASIEIMYKDEEGELDLDTLTPNGKITHKVFEQNYYENPGQSELASPDYHVTSMANLDGVKPMLRLHEERGNLRTEKSRKLSDNFVLGMNADIKDRVERGVTPETVKSVTLSEEYWQQLDDAWHNNPEQYKEMKIELSKATANIDVEAGHAVNAKVENGERVYEEIRGETYREIAPQLEL